MIARGFKPVAWVAAIGTAALGCYMLSLRVASERAELAGLERKIVTTQKAIRSLETELDTRGRVTQLQQWNDDILALVPPSAGQFLESQMMLAQFQVQPTPAIQNPAEVRMAAAEVPAPAPSVTPPAQRAVAVPRPAQPATVQRASLNVPPPTAATLPAPNRAASKDLPRSRTTPQRSEARATTPQTRAQPSPQRERTPARTPAQRRQTAATTSTQRPRTAAPPPPTRTAAAAAAPSQRSRTTATQTPPRRAALEDRNPRDTGAPSRSERRGGARN